MFVIFMGCLLLEQRVSITVTKGNNSVLGVSVYFYYLQLNFDSHWGIRLWEWLNNVQRLLYWKKPVISELQEFFK